MGNRQLATDRRILSDKWDWLPVRTARVTAFGSVLGLKRCSHCLRSSLVKTAIGGNIVFFPKLRDALGG